MEKRIVTIFIHGTLPPAAFLKLPVLKNFFWCPQGLHPLKKLSQTFHLAELGHILCSKDPTLFGEDSFYLFGWSGILQAEARKKAAQKLAHALKEVKTLYSSQGLECAFRLITHSHGGNVALYMAELSQDQDLDLDFTIDELILLACPVQNETASYVKHPLFSSIISAHSHSDIIQLIDPQGIHNFLKNVHTYGLEAAVVHVNEVGPLFSGRHFEQTPHLKQVHVKYPNRELLHIEFILARYIESLPKFIRDMHSLPQESKEELLYIIS